MNAIPMLEACFRHQWLYHLYNECAHCGERLIGGQWRCATCALKAEIELLERRAA